MCGPWQRATQRHGSSRRQLVYCTTAVSEVLAMLSVTMEPSMTGEDGVGHICPRITPSSACYIMYKVRPMAARGAAARRRGARRRKFGRRQKVCRPAGAGCAPQSSWTHQFAVAPKFVDGRVALLPAPVLPNQSTVTVCVSNSETHAHR